MPHLFEYLSLVLVLCYTFFIIVLWYGLLKAQHYASKKKSNTQFVSVIIAVRNESENISTCLNALLNQTYLREHFEIIIVDDASTDCTLALLQKFAKNPSLYILQNSSRKKYRSTKKSALETAIQKSAGDLLLFTDADCTPPPTWIHSIIEHFEPNTGLVAGFSPQQSPNKGLNELLRIDAAAAAVVSAATIGFGRGITCAGRHLAYRKQAWKDVGGFAALPDSLSGDDDFMLQAISHHPEWDVKYVFDENSIVLAKGPHSIHNVIKQKQRHISAGLFYPLAAQLGFALYHALNVLIWIISIAGIFFQPLWVIFLGLKFISDYYILKEFLKQFRMTIRIASFLIWEVYFVYVNTVSGPLGFLKKINW